MEMAAMTTGTHKRNSAAVVAPLTNGSLSSENNNETRIQKTKQRLSSGHSNGKRTVTPSSQRISCSSPSSSSSSPSSLKPRRINFAVLFLGCVALLCVIQWTLNAVLFETMMEENNQSRGIPKPSLSVQIATLQRQLLQWQEQTQIYSDDGNFYPFSIRDSRRLVPTQLPPGFHVWDYVDITTQNQQGTKRASLFHDAKWQAEAPCQQYNLLCYKQKIIQVFEKVLEQNPTTQYFFYMEADNELCTTLTDLRRLAYQYQRYFITTGIGFSGWVMHRQFMVDFIQLLKDYVPPPSDPDDILSQQGPQPSEGPDPIAADFLIEQQSWTVTRKYLVSHSIQPSLGVDALTVRMPGADSPTADPPPAGGGNSTAAEAAANAKKKNKGLEKHLPRCWEPRRSKWRISKKDHRDRFGWDYFDYDECDGEVFPCYDGQLQELLARDMASFNYTQLDMERQKLIAKQKERQRNKLLKEQGILQPQLPGNNGAPPLTGVAGAAIALQQQQQQQQYRLSQVAVNSNNSGLKGNNAELSERLKALTEQARRRHAERLQEAGLHQQQQGGEIGGGGGLRGAAAL